MPYGIPDETPDETKKMESCIANISGENPNTKKPYTDDEKIAICKAQIMKSRDNSDMSENAKKTEKSDSNRESNNIITVLSEKIDKIIKHLKLSNDINVSDWLPILNVVTVKGHKITAETLKLIEKNYNTAKATKGFEAPIILGHTDDNDKWNGIIITENVPAFAYVESLKFNETDNMLYYRVYKQISKFREFVENGFDKVSAEIKFKHSNNDIPTPIISAIAMLGAQIPAISEAIIDVSKLSNDTNNDSTVITSEVKLNEYNYTITGGEKMPESTPENVIAKTEYDKAITEKENKIKELEIKLAETERKTKIDKISSLVEGLPEPVKNSLLKLAEVGFSSTITEIKLSESDISENVETVISNHVTWIKKNLETKLANTDDAGEASLEEAGMKSWKDSGLINSEK